VKELSFSEVLNKISKGNLLPQQFYNVDLDYTQHFATSHFLKNKEDNIDKNQKLNKFFTDIEVYTKHSGEFPEVKHAKFPINAISTYSSIDDTCHCFFMFYDKSQVKPEKEIEDYLFNESLKDGYISKNQKIKVYLFDNSKDLVIAFWNLVKTQDPSVLSGFFSDSFDYPYMYYFLLNQFNGDHQAAANIISKFGVVDLDNGRDRAGKDIAWIRPAEYVICDLLYFYKPRDDGGLSLGKKLPAYNLAFVSEYELGISKLEYKQKGLTLDRFWEKDPLNFLLYNVWDCLLCYKLDEKLGMIDQYNIQRRAMKTPMGTAIRGSSPLFDTFVCYSLTDTNHYIRFGIVD
jgi:DNA polymerase elongation subunit (family B)